LSIPTNPCCVYRTRPTFGKPLPLGEADLGYLKAHGIADFGFLDLRLGTPPCYEATYSATGVFGESFVMDVPDLPLVLQLLAANDSNRPHQIVIDELIERYCMERGISATISLPI
jgi:hypothetical protein